MSDMTFPDFSGKVVACELSTKPDIPFTVIEEPTFEMQGGRVFLTGMTPHGVNDDDWCAGAPCAVAWDSVLVYYVFESLEDLEEKTGD